MVEIPEHWKPQATSRMCFVCGRENPVGLHIQFYEDHVAQQVVVPLVIPDAYQGYPGVAHGGVLAAILDEISGTNLVDHIKTFHHFSKTGMNPIKVSSIRTTVTNKKLGATCITTCMRH
mgnify:CR=1 FL=1